MDNLITSLGLMSGTSLDGIDASIIRSDGEDKIEILEKLADDKRASKLTDNERSHKTAENERASIKLTDNEKVSTKSTDVDKVNLQKTSSSNKSLVSKKSISCKNPSTSFLLIKKIFLLYILCNFFFIEFFLIKKLFSTVIFFISKKSFFLFEIKLSLTGL